MTQADRIAAALRPIAPRGKLVLGPPVDEVALINSLGASWEARLEADPAASPGVAVLDPAWVVAGRKMIGLREVPGPMHNPTILGFWKLGAPWLKTDDSDSPWCGGFMAFCMKEAGLSFPKQYPRAASWRDYGEAAVPQVGAIGVKARKGGNHVFMIVGKTADDRNFKALGGNQSNGVNVIDIRQSDVDAIRWPPGVPQAHIPLPIMAPGTLGASEA